MVSKKTLTLIYFPGVSVPQALRDFALENNLALRGMKFYEGEREKCDFVGGLIPPAYEGVSVTKHQDEILEILRSGGVNVSGVSNPTPNPEKDDSGTAQGQNGADSEHSDDEEEDEDDNSSDSADSDGNDNGNAGDENEKPNRSIKKVKKARK